MRREVRASAFGRAFALLLASPGAADEWVLGLGADDVFDTHNKVVAAFLAEYHSDPFSQSGRASFSWMAALQADTDGDVLAVGGIYFLMRSHGSWVVEASLGAGALHQGSNPLKPRGSFQFRTSIGAGYELDSGTRISLSIDHLFNKDFRNTAPGTETVLLRYTRQF